MSDWVENRDGDLGARLSEGLGGVDLPGVRSGEGDGWLVDLFG